MCIGVTSRAPACDSRHLRHEHAGLAAIEQDEQLNQLLMGLTPARADTIHRIPVPTDAAGKSLRESNFRGTYGSQVIGVQQPDGQLQCPPDIDAPLPADAVLVIGSKHP